MDVLSFGDVPWFGVFVATVAMFLVGAAWFHARTLGPKWAELVGISSVQQRERPAFKYGTFAAMAVATSLLLGMLMAQLIVTSVLGGALFGAVLALVFRFANHAFHNAFEMRPFSLTLINGLHDVVAMAAAGAVLGAFL